jgi:uncharacterized lipoprotein YbaY/heat shock protein HslJ
VNKGILTLLALIACLPAACQQQGPGVSQALPLDAFISGTITYRERIALSPQAVVEISLQDVSRADAPAKLIAHQRITNPGQVPIPFEIRYKPEDIDERMTYAVQARILEGGRPMFINDTHTAVLTRGAGNRVEMVLVRVQAPADSEAGVTSDIADGSGDHTPGMALEGMFRYMADAAIFRDCRSGKEFPVAMESAYINLERAYLENRGEPGSEVMVRLRGRYLERPAMEGDRREVHLIVEQLEEILPGESCEPDLHAKLTDTYWKLLELDGEPVNTPDGMREAHVILASAESRAHGFAGCNNFFGGYGTEGESLTFSAMGATMMACPEGMDTEQAFLAALGEITRFTISGQFLQLYANDHLLARFEAIYL